MFFTEVVTGVKALLTGAIRFANMIMFISWVLGGKSDILTEVKRHNCKDLIGSLPRRWTEVSKRTLNTINKDGRLLLTLRLYRRTVERTW